MHDDFSDEKWKPIVFDFEYTNQVRIEISNYGRIRTFNYLSDGHIRKLGLGKQGYPMFHARFFKPREESVAKRLAYLKEQSFKLARDLKAMKESNKSKRLIAETTKLLEDFKQNLSKKYYADTAKRTIYYHEHIHRLVAYYFLRKPTSHQTIVGHIDYNKENNKADNLKWMTLEENYKHQRGSPAVIEYKAKKKVKTYKPNKVYKLTVTKVMLLKKLLNEGKPMPNLVRQFKITHTQILRIKRGINWGEIPAAK